MHICNLQKAWTYNNPLYCNHYKQEKSKCTNNLSQEKKLAKYTKENLQAHYLANTINFGAQYRISARDFPLAKLQGHICCPCCGEKMYNSDTASKKLLTEMVAGKKGKTLSKILKKNLNEFQPSKRELVIKLSDAALKYPDKGIAKLLKSISTKYTNSLKEKQRAVINGLIDELPDLSGTEKKAVKWWQKQQIAIINARIANGNFSNRKFQNSFEEFANEHGIRLDKRKIEQYFSRLPNSKKDTDAFVFKYKRKSADKIICAMQKDVSPTIEHIKEFSVYKNNNQANLMVMCKDCNETRGVLPYNIFIKIRPEIERNIYRYFEDCEKVIKGNLLNSNDKKHLRHYVPEIKETLAALTGGALK